MEPRRKLELHRRSSTRPPPRPAAPPWRVLVVDDDAQVHAMTRVLLRDFEFEGRPFECVEASSAREAADLLAADPDMPVVLLDVVMETADAGLKLVHRIRDELGNSRVRIILRTGQPGEAPERDVVLAYDVNDYKSKAELTASKLFTALVGAVRAWRDIATIARLNDELRQANATLEARVAERTEALGRAKERAETALARETEAKRQLRQFLSMVSHEFRTPLAIIDSSAQMLSLKAETSDPSMLPRLQTIRGGVQRLIGLIDTCLADEQLDSGRITLHEQPVDLAALLEATIEAHRAAHPGSPFELACRAAPAAWGDAGMLALVMNNLVANAVKYSPQGAPVAVTLWDDHGSPAVSVRDHGIGIPADERAAVFERFTRGSNARGIPGSGIGLHMVRQIVELHGGTVVLDSAVGAGSCFTVRLRPAPRGL